MDNLTEKITLDGDRSFDFSCSIQVGNKFIQLTQSAILYLEIRESIFNGFPEGMLLIDNNTGGADSVFVFNGDNITDLLLIYLAPAEVDDNDNYKIKEVFTIYKVEDVPVGEYPQGAKKLFFRNTLANELRVKKNTITVEDFDPFDDSSGLTDNQRSFKTGTILKKLFGKDNNKPDEMPRTGDFQIDENEWDEGKYSLFPNWCPGTETLYESIQKVYLKHISAEEPYDKCYLKYNRFDKKLSLVPLNKLLLKNKTDSQNYFIENLVLGTFNSGSDPDKEEVSSPGVPLPVVNSSDTLLDISNIRAFKFFDLSSDILEKDLVITIPPVIDFNNTTRFNLGESDVKRAHDFFVKYYVEEPFNHKVTSGNALPSLIWANVRKKITTQYNKVLVTPFKSWDHAFDVEVMANLLNVFTFKGLNCTFSLRGATHRTIGKFVDIEQKDTFITNKFAKVPGRWLVTECSHIIIKDKYWNNLKCVKTYRNF